MQLIGRLFNRSRETNSRSAVKQRLQLVIAHDRAALSPATIASMQAEILAVVSRYVEIDTDKLNFALKSSDRMTSLTADLPIRRIRKTPLEVDTTGGKGTEGTEGTEQPHADYGILFNETIELDFELEDEPESGVEDTSADTSNDASNDAADDASDAGKTKN